MDFVFSNPIFTIIFTVRSYDLIVSDAKKEKLGVEKAWQFTGVWPRDGTLINL